VFAISVALWRSKALGWSGAQQPDDEIGYVWEVAHNPDWKLADDGSVRLP